MDPKIPLRKCLKNRLTKVLNDSANLIFIFFIFHKVIKPIFLFLSMGIKSVVAFAFVVVFVLLFFSYWFIPSGYSEFQFYGERNSNFTLSSLDSLAQFYPNMRFPDKNISYRIDSCNLKRTNDAQDAFEILKEKTILDFYPVQSNEEITITCDDAQKVEGRLVIAGEGGPTRVIETSNYNVIQKGSVLILKDSDCPNPNVVIHEVLHVLGFNHSENSNNIMYPVSKCSQEIGDDTLNLINELYSVDSLPDLLVDNSSASMKGRFLNMEISVRNDGLVESQKSKLIVYVDGTSVKDFELDSIDIGYGRIVTFENIFVSKFSVEEIEIEIVYDFEELNKNNNKIKLNVKD